MEPFPPIFAYVIFFILDLIAFVLDLTVVASIAGVFISFLSTFFYILWVFFRYGPGKATEKLFSFKNKTGKKIMKIFGGSVIPFVNVWAVYDDYKQELKEYRNKELGITEDTSQNKGSGFLKKLALGAGVIATGGLAAGAIVGEAAVAGEAAGAMEVAGATESAVATNAGRTAGNELISTPGKTKKLGNVKTIEEEVGGVKTGMNREDYDAGIKNYGDFDTYTRENKEKEEEKVKQTEEKKKNAEAKRIQGLKVEKDLREEMLDKSQRRYGEDTNELRAIKGGDSDNSEENIHDEYREAA